MVDQGDVIDETTINVGRRIRSLRKQRNLSQQALADASGLSRNTLSLLERGQTSPTVSTLKRLAISLDVEIDSFYGHDGFLIEVDGITKAVKKFLNQTV